MSAFVLQNFFFKKNGLVKESLKKNVKGINKYQM